jgi:hypothetical protein
MDIAGPLGFWVAQRFQRCDQPPFNFMALASEVHPHGTASLASSEPALSFPRTSTAETE